MSVLSRLSLSDGVRQVLGEPAPVLVGDTCAFLDILRLANPARQHTDAQRHGLYVERCLKSILRIEDAVKARPRRAWMVIPIQVVRERDRRRDGTREETRREWEKHLTVERFGRIIARSLQQNVASASFFDWVDGLTDSVERLESDAYDVSVVIEDEAICLSQATERAITLTPPAFQGKPIGDAIIHEHLLEFARQLRQAGFGHEIVFLSSNVTDYCDKRGYLIPSIEREYSAVRVRYCRSWDAADAVLFRIPLMPVAPTHSASSCANERH